MGFRRTTSWSHGVGSGIRLTIGPGSLRAISQVGHEARMKELTDARDLQLEQEEHKLNDARAAAVQEKRKRTTRDGKHLFSTTSLSRPGSGN